MTHRMARILVATAGLVATGGATFQGSAPVRRAEATARADSVAVAVYEGRTPCAPIATEFTGFPSANCEKIKWEVTFFTDRATGRPRAFLYEGTRTTRRGTWTIHRGTPFDPDAEVYRLTPDPPGKALSLLHLDGKVLLLLDTQLRVVPGDAGYSYVLNRTDKGMPK